MFFFGRVEPEPRRNVWLSVSPNQNDLQTNLTFDSIYIALCIIRQLYQIELNLQP